MPNLEKLVDEYKTKIDELEKKNLEYNKSSIITNEKTPSNKRQRLESNYTFKTQAIELEKENIEILEYSFNKFSSTLPPQINNRLLFEGP